MFAVVVLAALIARASAQSLACPPQPSNTYAYSVRADGNLNIGFYACVHDAVAQGQITFNDHSKASGIVWTSATGGVEVDYNVVIGDEELIKRGGFAYVWTSDADNIIYSPNLVTGAPFVCIPTTALQSCDTAGFCASKTGNVALAFGTDDLIIYERYETKFVHDEFGNSKAIQVAVPYEISDKYVFRDVTIGRRSVVKFMIGRTYTFRRLFVEEDATIELADETGKDYSIYVEEAFETGERVRIVPKSDNRVLIYQNADFGVVHIDNAPANRDHVLNLDIIARGQSSSGSVVSIGYRQFIRGSIVARSDVFINNFAQIGRRCYSESADVEAEAAARYARYQTYLHANFAKVAAANKAPAAHAANKAHAAAPKGKAVKHPKLTHHGKHL